MKKLLLMSAMVFILAACERQDVQNEPDAKWNGYFNYLKQGEVVHTLWAGRHINAGTVTYGIDNSANFYVTYDCGMTGWLISETHMYAGDKKHLPVNKPGNPKIGRFPHASNHNPIVSTVTYTVPLSQLPPAEDPGFIVAAHCVVHGPNGQTETAWAEGDFSFTDKDWGWYDVYYYNQLQNPFVIIYGIEYSSDSLKLRIIDITNNTSVLVMAEEVGDIPGKFDAAAYDEATSTFFFANCNSGELWANSMDSDAPSAFIGTVPGTPESGTFWDGSFYYVESSQNTINRVVFGAGWSILSVDTISTIPNSLSVNDIEMNYSGTVMYIVGQVDGGNSELISYDLTTNTYYSTSLAISAETQIAYGNDGNLYAITGASGNTGIQAYLLDTASGVMTPINDAIEGVDDPFTDVSRGRVM